MNKKIYPWYIITFVIILKFTLEYLFVSSIYELHRDEFLHLDQANHLAWGYPSLPPLTSWIAVIIKFLGNGIFWVRFFPALAGAITIWLVWETVKLLKGSLYAALLASFSVLFSALLRINILFQPNSMDILFFTLILFFVIKHIQSEKNINLYFLGISIGFGMMNKYTIAFLVAGLIVAILFTPQRKLLSNKHFYGAIGLAFIIFLPNIIWQIQHHFPVIWHLNTLERTQLVNVNTSDFIGEQIKFFAGSVFIWVVGLILLFVYPPFKNYRIIGIAFVTAMALFIYFHAKGYYAIGLYPILFPFGAIYFDQMLSKKYLNWSKPTIVILNVMLLIWLAPVIFPLSSPKYIASHPRRFEKLGMLRWEDGKNHQLPQDFADMLGWKELARKTEQAFEMIPKNEQAQTLVIADNYGQTGAVNFYSKHIRNAASFTFDYLDLFPDFSKIKHYIVIGEKSDNKDIAHFKSFQKIGEIENLYAREKGTGIYLLSYHDETIAPMLKKRLSGLKADL
nr:glycosyltransferase family 39 protein [Pseudopedobacter sp.]